MNGTRQVNLEDGEPFHVRMDIQFVLLNITRELFSCLVPHVGRDHPVA